MTVSVMLLASCSNDKKKEDGDKKETSMSSGESKQERNKKVIMASMEAFNKGEIDNVFNSALVFIAPVCYFLLWS